MCGKRKRVTMLSMHAYPDEGHVLTVEMKCESCDDNWNSSEEVEEGGLSIQLG